MNFDNYFGKSVSRRPMGSQGQVKQCRVCNREISLDNTPRHLFYSNFCCEECKDRYMFSTDL